MDLEESQTKRFIYSFKGVLLMRCPNCGNEKSRVLETRQSEGFDLRVRQCGKCGKPFKTSERVAVYSGKTYGYAEVQPQSETAILLNLPEKKDKLKASQWPKAKRFVAKEGHEYLDFICAEAKLDVLEWWNVARWNKHKSKAVWTENAFVKSMERLADLPPYQQKLLASKGAETGWQSLDAEYLPKREQVKPVDNGKLEPKDPAMKEALAKWD